MRADGNGSSYLPESSRRQHKPSGPGKSHPVTVDQVDPEGARQDSKSDSVAEDSELDRELL
jgi:hypothetical protein